MWALRVSLETDSMSTNSKTTSCYDGLLSFWRVPKDEEPIIISRIARESNDIIGYVTRTFTAMCIITLSSLETHEVVRLGKAISRMAGFRGRARGTEWPCRSREGS